MHQLEKEAAEQVRGLEREVALFAVGPLLNELREKWDGHDEVLAYLGDVEDDIGHHLDDFREEASTGQPMLLAAGRSATSSSATASTSWWTTQMSSGAPVVIERNPTYYNLVGRVEYRAAFGSMVTDFREIKAGALHRANGGYLVLEAFDLLRQPFAWDALKRALRGREVQIENLGEQYSAVPSSTLRPEAVPLAVKVVLIGPPLVYRLLYQLDEDFRELFKVKADFAPEMEWNAENALGYARLVGAASTLPASATSTARPSRA